MSSSLLPLSFSFRNLLYNHTIVIRNACVGDSDLPIRYKTHVFTVIFTKTKGSSKFLIKKNLLPSKDKIIFTFKGHCYLLETAITNEG